MQSDLQRIHDTLTSTYWFWKYEKKEECPSDLLTALTSRLTHIEPASWEKRLAFGGVFVNGQLAQANRPLPCPCKVEYYEPKFSIDEAASLFDPFSLENIVFEDNDLIVYFKPCGIPTIPNREQRSYNVKVYLEDYLKKRVHMPSRLDTSTSGLVIASKSSEMHPRLQRLFERRLIGKTYLLEVPGEVPWQKHTVDAPIGYSPTHRVLRQIDKENGQHATTHFTLISSLAEAKGAEETGLTTILAAKPVTGRTHQIRVHVTACTNQAIIGDSFYRGRHAEELHLMSYQLSFIHPITSSALCISCPEKLFPAWLSRLNTAKIEQLLATECPDSL